MADTDYGRALLDSLGFKDIQRAEDSTWDDVRELNIKKLSAESNTVAEQSQ